jgi:hypothetical protein
LDANPNFEYSIQAQAFGVIMIILDELKRENGVILALRLDRVWAATLGDVE